MEYSRVQTLKAYKSYKIVLSYEHVIVFYVVLWKLRTDFEISAWNGSYVRVIKIKISAWQVLKF